MIFTFKASQIFIQPQGYLANFYPVAIQLLFICCYISFSSPLTFGFCLWHLLDKLQYFVVPIPLSVEPVIAKETLTASLISIPLQIIQNLFKTRSSAGRSGFLYPHCTLAAIKVGQVLFLSIHTGLSGFLCAFNVVLLLLCNSSC